MMSRILGILLAMFGVAVFLGTPPAVADETGGGAAAKQSCDCAPGDPWTGLPQDAVVTRARIDRVEYNEPAGEVVFTITPLHFWRGQLDSSFLVSSKIGDNLADHGDLGDEWLIVADQPKNGIYAARCCLQSQPYDNFAQRSAVETFGAGKIAVLDPKHPVGEPKLDGVRPNLTSAVIGGGVLAVLLGIVVLQMVSRRRERRVKG